MKKYVNLQELTTYFFIHVPFFLNIFFNTCVNLFYFFFRREKGNIDECFQFSNFPSFSRFPTSLKHRREKKKKIGKSGNREIGKREIGKSGCWALVLKLSPDLSPALTPN